ncbi:MAG: GNAT family N-acetyltransferase [Bordetella sp.]|uniref:GNAT family N-acetyltransferase n=1 Tax=Bordetella sp. TaxID=28081 RepID=UPI003F7C38AE
MIDITHDESRGRFACIVDGYHCELDYRVDGQRMVILHTGVPHQVGGRGIAADLTCAALDTARSRGWKVLPLCSYAEAYVRRHPEYSDLLA